MLNFVQVVHTQTYTHQLQKYKKSVCLVHSSTGKTTHRAILDKKYGPQYLKIDKDVASRKIHPQL